MHLQPVFQGYEVTLPRPLPAREGLGEDRCFAMGRVCRRGRRWRRRSWRGWWRLFDTPGNVVGRGMVRSQHHIRTDRNRIHGRPSVIDQLGQGEYNGCE